MVLAEQMQATATVGDVSFGCLKKDAPRLRRVANPRREGLNRLARLEHRAVSKEETVYFRDVYDHIYRVTGMLESFRDVLSGAMEVYLTVVSNRTNEIMKVLTVFSIILMSASLIAGLYGMNVPIPGAGSKGSFRVLLASMASWRARGGCVSSAGAGSSVPA